jgi:uncharacterized protein YbjT (DUF2867 family)
MDSGIDVVTGAFGYTGKFIARRLLAQGRQVITLTGHPERANEFAGRVPAYPFNFHDPAALTASLQGVDTLYNTYWVRFNYGQTTFEQAVTNTRTLFECAKVAGVRRIVHTSICNPSLDSPLPYYRGKAQLEEALRQSGISYAILRPTVIFSLEDVLVNNIAYLLRHFPLFAVPGTGDYSLQPVFVEDMAELALNAGRGSENIALDVVGPEVYTFNALVDLMAGQLHSRARIIHVAPRLALALSRLVGFVVGDVVLTEDELEGLSTGLLVSKGAPTGMTSFRAWLEQNAAELGRRYASELDRHFLQ